MIILAVMEELFMALVCTLVAGCGLEWKVLKVAFLVSKKWF
jgi:hypothetical protein